MSQETQAELFIRVLTELWEEDQALKKARLRLEVKAHVQRFVYEFRAELADRRRRPTWTQHRARPSGLPVTQIHGE